MDAKTLKILFIPPGILVLLITIGTIVNCIFGYHHTRFTIHDRLNVEILFYERDSFLDWPVNIEMCIKDFKTGKEYNMEYEMGWGPYIRFCTTKTPPYCLLIEEYDRNGNWPLTLIQLDDLLADELPSRLDSSAREKFSIVYEITGKFEAKEINP